MKNELIRKEAETVAKLQRAGKQQEAEEKRAKLLTQLTPQEQMDFSRHLAYYLLTKAL